MNPSIVQRAVRDRSRAWPEGVRPRELEAPSGTICEPANGVTVAVLPLETGDRFSTCAPSSAIPVSEAGVGDDGFSGGEGYVAPSGNPPNAEIGKSDSAASWPVGGRREMDLFERVW